MDSSRRQEHRYQRARPRVDDNLNNIKINIPPFHGKTDPEAYLAWEKKIEHIFECHNYSELKKVKLAAIEFVDYALIWWDQLTSSRRRNGERPISTWNEMKAIMRRRFIPTHYHRELFNKLQNLKQSNQSVEDYYKEMEVAMIRANIDEDREATMARFLAGLDPDIANVVELQHYINIDDMVHMAMKVEKQLKRKGATRPYASNTSKWGHGSNKKNVSIPTKDGSGSSKPNKPIIESNKGKNTSNPVRSRDVQCFKCLGRGHIASQCPNRNAMFIRENGEIESDHEEEEETEVPIDEEEMEFAVDGEALVVKRSLSTQVMESEQQRENIFHTRCHVNGKVCFVIIDGGSCTNVASNLMIEKLGLPTTKHPQPYKLQWLNDGGEIKVTKQARIPFSIGKYKDEILCDVVPMHAGHLLLGRPWQFDRRAIHDGFTNRYSFAYEGKKITLAPLTPRQVHEDQIHLRKSIEKAKESEKDRVEKSKEGACPLCGSGLEDTLHALCDCPDSSLALRQAGFANTLPSTDQTSAAAWLGFAASTLSQRSLALLLTLLWGLWRRQNTWVHERTLYPLHLTIESAISFCHDYASAFAPSQTPPTTATPTAATPPDGARPPLAPSRSTLMAHFYRMPALVQLESLLVIAPARFLVASHGPSLLSALLLLWRPPPFLRALSLPLPTTPPTTAAPTAAAPPRWRLPPTGSVKINVDGAFLPTARLGAIGVLARDSSSAVLGGFAWHIAVIGPTSSVEASALFAGLEFAIANGWASALIEYDAAVLFNKLHRPTPDLSLLGDLLAPSRHLIAASCGRLHVGFAPRSANFAAHTLASWASQHNDRKEIVKKEKRGGLHSTTASPAKGASSGGFQRSTASPKGEDQHISNSCQSDGRICRSEHEKSKLQGHFREDWTAISQNYSEEVKELDEGFTMVSLRVGSDHRSGGRRREKRRLTTG
ncbi:hypothetical protein GQ457_18G009050 [Hibiscus cannabinus]